MKFSIIRRPFTYRYYNVSFILIGINLLVYLLNQLMPETRLLLAMNPVLVTQRGMVWQVFTYMFVHAGLTHILFNMLGLFFFGYQVEQRMGSNEFLLFYLLSGFGAGLFSLIVYLLSGSYMVILLGASGAVFAVLLAFASFFPRANIYVFGILPIRAPILVLLYTVIELFSQFANVSSGVAHLTHLAGFGMAYLYLVVRLRMNPIKIFIEDRRR